ncbi:MAG TPA: hypothetical protein VKY73_24705 [Polyangiaceae bacterium]|nr:hypothetical protein [Polyangiaceae bacterium]
MARTSRRAVLTLFALLPAPFLPRTGRADMPPLVGRPAGRPRIAVGRISFPPGTAHIRTYTRHLREVLRREAERVDWGAGRGSTITFRFAVEKLVLTGKGNALEVHCSARGELPGARTARSRLTFGGDPRNPRRLVQRVLEIVARGVVGRLAELERSRRERARG